jgi:hypothetical protein
VHFRGSDDAVLGSKTQMSSMDVSSTTLTAGTIVGGEANASSHASNAASGEDKADATDLDKAEDDTGSAKDKPRDALDMERLLRSMGNPYFLRFLSFVDSLQPSHEHRCAEL